MMKKTKKKRYKKTQSIKSEKTKPTGFSMNFRSFLLWLIGCLIVVVIGSIKDVDWNLFTIIFIPIEGLIVYGILGGIADTILGGKYGYFLVKPRSPLDI